MSSISEPPSEELPTERVVFPTPVSARIHEQLQRLISVGTADFFHDACTLVSGSSSLHAKSHLIAHLTREIVSAVRAVVAALPGVSERAAEIGQDPSIHEELASELRSAGLSEDDAKIAVSTIAARREFESVFTPNAKNTATAALEVLRLEGRDVEHAWNTVLASPSWHGYAHRAALGRPRRFTSEFRTHWSQFLESLHKVLLAIETQFSMVFLIISELKSIEAPSKAQCRTVAQDLPRVPVVMSRFFDGLGPGWLAGLHKKKLFANPPMAIRTDTEVRYPAWPQGRYLKETAQKLPKDVCNVILSIPQTDNVFVHADIVDAALAMQPAERAQVLEQELSWVQGLGHIDGMAASTIEELTEQLATDGNTRLCTAFLRHVMGFTSDKAGFRPGTRLDDWHYERLVKGAVRKLISAAPLDAAELLRALLVEAQQDSPSASWRAAIEEHQQNHVEGPQDFLVASLRDVYEEIAAESPDKVHEVYADLYGQRHVVFQRLALHILRIHGEHAQDLVEATCKDPAILNSYELRHEAMEMLAAQLPKLPKPSREGIIAAVCQAKSPEGLKHSAAENGIQVDDEEAARRSEWALRDWLSIIGDEQLTGAEKLRLEELIQRHGEPSHPSFGSYWWSGRVERSPVTEAELAALTDAELVDFLANWEPQEGNGHLGPDREGLARELRSVIRTQQARFPGLAPRFRNLPPEFIEAFLDTVGGKASQETSGDEIEWDPVIELCESLDQIVPPAIEHGMGRLLESLLSHPDDLPDGILFRAWGLLIRLIESSDPTGERERDDWRDALTFAINTTRGRALDVAIDLLCALLRQAPLSAERAELVEAIKEAVLVRIHNESCRPVLSVLATAYTRLFVADQSYCEGLADRLFLQDGAITPLFHVFLRWNSACGPTFERLQEAYAQAIATAGADLHSDGDLGEHLIRLAVWRRISFEQLEDYFVKSSLKGRSHALGDFGRALSNTKELSDELVETVQRAWATCFQAARKCSTTDDIMEFGWWFVSPALPAAWRLARLEEALLETGGHIDWDHKVVEELAALAQDSPAPVAACLRLLITGCNHGYTHFLGRESLVGALKTLLANTRTGDAASEIISLLAARGHTDYLQLLPSHH